MLPREPRFCGADALVETCDVFRLTVDTDASYWDTHEGGAVVEITWTDPTDDFDLYVRDSNGNIVASSNSASGTSERAIVDWAFGDYDVMVVPFRVVDSGYAGSASFVSEPFAPVETSTSGPCTDKAALSMPDVPTHDHQDVNQHRFSCRVRQVFFDSLLEELAAENDVVLGEMDVENGLAAVGVAFPESGVLFFDVSDPAQPKFLSWYRGSKCEEVVFDVDCGAYVDLSSDGKVAFLSVQDISVVPGGAPDAGVRPVSEPGVEVIDVRDPRQPQLTQAYPVLSLGGVHTSRSHVIAEGSTAGGPRAPGEYLFSIANGFGVEITRVSRLGGILTLTPVNRIDIDEVRDTFIQDDPLTGRTYLYVAAGLESGFYVYDVTDPGQETLLAEWDPTPECGEDWYGHTVDTAIRNGRRYVTIDAEIFNFGTQPQEDQDQGCGAVFGNGDKPGPLWIVDVTDFSKLGPAQALGGDGDDAQQVALKAASEAALVTTWTNPAARASGHLRFSSHNQQIVGDRIYLSHYHGGVYVLDASAAFRGEDARPRELGFIVPHGAETRPLHSPSVQPLSPFFSTFPADRPTIWDMVFYRGYILAADMYGGFYSLQYKGDR